MTRLTITLAVLIACAPTYVAAQGLADVARAEEARRKAVEQTTAGKTAKVYTNGNLKPDNTGPAPSALAPDALAPSVTPPDAPVAPKADAPVPPQREEKFWTARLSAAREALDRNKMFGEALQSRINGLNADFVNRDDPNQRGAIAIDRDKALAELKRVQIEIDAQTKAIAAIQDEGRRAGVPAGWLR